MFVQCGPLFVWYVFVTYYTCQQSQFALSATELEVLGLFSTVGIWSMSNDAHQLLFIKLHHFKLEIDLVISW